MGPPERRIGEQGVREAIARLARRVAAREARDEFGFLVPFAEALNWIYALDEWHSKQLGPRYRNEIRATARDGRCTGAITWVRGKVAHSLIDATSTRLVDPRIVSWAPANLLPHDPRDEAQAHHRDQWYEQEVAAKPLLEPLRRAQHFLRSLP